LKEFFANSDLANPANYMPSGVPTQADDVLITTPAGSLVLNGAELTAGSLNITGTNSYTISNNNPGATNSALNLGTFFGNTNVVSPFPTDTIYVGGAEKSLTLQGANSGGGTGTLQLFLTYGGRINVAHPSSTLNASASISLGISQTLTKAGAGTMNVSGSLGGLSAGVSVEEGTMNFLPGTSISGRLDLIVAPGSGTAANVSIRTSLAFSRLSGSASGSIDLVGAATQLTLGRNAPASSATPISGAGSLVLVGTGSADLVWK
jgi:hypothetical protein